MFTKEEVYNETLKYFNGNDMQTSIWMDKYALKNNNKYLEKTPDDMHKRLAKEFARIEQKYPNPLSYEEIYDLLHNFKFILPAGSILYGLGNNYSISSLGNCFVIGNKSDSYGGIFQSDQEQAQLMKRRAGVGHDLSHLRPALTPVTNAAGTSTGAISFAERFSNTTREVGQNNRRGALMLSMNIDHKDIEQFITSKSDLTKITGANISVKLTNEFMETIGDYKLYAENNRIWNKLIHQAHSTAEPGCLFWTTITNESIPSCYGEEWKETSTNPCGEIPLCPYDSCRLLSVNLYSFVENPFTENAKFNYTLFKDIAYKAQRLMDDVVDLEEEKINLILNKIENDPEPESIKSVEKNLWLKIRDKLLSGRRTGLSAIGLADCFAALNIGYGTDNSILCASEIYKQFAISAYESSAVMAEERGCFPIFDQDKEIDNPFLNRLKKTILDEEDGEVYWDELEGFPRRNIALLTIPPSGTISMMAGISSGIEPVYQLYYKRRYKILENTEEKKAYDFVDQNGDKWKEFIVYHPKMIEWYKVFLKENREDYSEELFDKEVMQYVPEVTLNKSPYYKSTAYEIDPIQRVKLQGAIQKWIDHSISSTINLPEDVSESDVSDIYLTAWKEGLKGITIYRNNCRTGVLVDVDKKDSEFKQHDAPKRPKSLDCIVHKAKSRGKEWLVIVGLLNDKPYEVFTIENKYNIQFSEITGSIIKIKKGQYDLSLKNELYIENFAKDIPDTENLLTRMISTALRHGSNIQFIVEQLNKSEGDITSFGKATSRILKTYISNDTKTNNLCPECGEILAYKDGCVSCLSCGYSKCG